MTRFVSIGAAVLVAYTMSASPANAAVDAPLVDAAKAGDLARAQQLLQQGAGVNDAEPDGTTPLHWAAHGRHLELTRLLLGAGAVVNVGNRYGVRPLSLAAVNGDAPVIEALLEAGANPNIKHIGSLRNIKVIGGSRTSQGAQDEAKMTPRRASARRR